MNEWSFGMNRTDGQWRSNSKIDRYILYHVLKGFEQFPPNFGCSALFVLPRWAGSSRGFVRQYSHLLNNEEESIYRVIRYTYRVRQWKIEINRSENIDIYAPFGISDFYIGLVFHYKILYLFYSICGKCFNCLADQSTTLIISNIHIHTLVVVISKRRVKYDSQSMSDVQLIWR